MAALRYEATVLIVQLTRNTSGTWELSIQHGVGNEANLRNECCSAALRERRVGERRWRITRPKQRRVGLKRNPVRA